MLKGYTKEEKSWMMYDWANSAHSVIVVTLLPIFFSSVAGFMRNTTSAMSIWGYVTSIAMLISALLAPVIGALGDFKGMRKKMFFVFLAVGVLACAGLAVTPMTGFAENTGVAEAVGTAILILYVISQIGFSGANLYYDSFLPDVTTEERMDRVSTMGYGLGYIGGSTIPLLIFLVMNAVGVDMLYCLSFIFGFTAVWWAAFSWPLLKNVEQKSYQPHEKGAIRKTLRGLWATLKDIFGHKSIFVFMLAYFFYIDGVGTIIHMSTSYGAQLGLGDTEMMLALLLVQILGLPFCLMYIKLAGKFGARVMVGVGICIYMGICVFGFFVRETWQFWVLAILVATSQGGIQALSRSMFGKMLPDKNRSGEYFGFFDIFGKFSSVMGPALMGFVTQIATVVLLGRQSLTPETAPEAVLAAAQQEASPWGVLSVLLIFLVGAVLYFGVLPRMLKKEGAYTHIRIARAALAQSGEHAPSTAAYEMGANGPDPLFAYRVLSAKRPWPLPELGGRMHDEQCGRFLRTMIFAASTPAQRSYALGFLAHYAADSVMHPYVAFQCGPQGQFNIPEGHGFCEVAMDSMFHEQDCGSPAVPAGTAAPGLPPQELAEVTQMLHDAVAQVYRMDIPHEALADSFHDFHALHRLFLSPHGGKRALVWAAERLVLHKPGYGLSHMTPARRPADGFAEHWENPYTHAQMDAGPEALCGESARLAAGYLKAAAAYWEGRSTKEALAAAVGDRSYSTGLLSEPAPAGV